MSHRPLIVQIKHCKKDLLLQRGGYAWDYFEEEATRRSALHYNYPLIDACGFVNTIRTAACDGEPRINPEEIFNPGNISGKSIYTDHVHFSQEAMGIDGCLLSDLILSGQSMSV